MIRTISDLEKELKKISQDEIYEFIESFIYELCRLVKRGYKVESCLEGYFCSNCGYKLNEEEAWWKYCPNCLVNYDCCEEENEPCETCAAEIEKLVFETYKRIRRANP